MAEIIMKKPDITANDLATLIAQKFYDLERKSGEPPLSAVGLAQAFCRELSKNEGFYNYVTEDFRPAEYGECLRCKRGFVPDASVYADKELGNGLAVRFSGLYWCPKCLKVKSRTKRERHTLARRKSR